MPIMPIPTSQDHTPYYLICYDKHGDERKDDPDLASGILSEEVLRLAKTGQYTDIFFMSHGWKGDIPAAIDQYNRWIAAMMACKQDLARLKARPQGFKPLVIGLHWPSLPFGMEEHAEPSTINFSINPSSTDIYQAAIDAVADTEAGQQAVLKILDSAIQNSRPAFLDQSTQEAVDYLLEHELKASPLNDELTNVDAQSMYQVLKQQMDADLLSFGNSLASPVLGLVTQLSMWKMKERARSFGASGAAQLLRQLLAATQSTVQFHLMGHSFGTIVIASAVTGQQGREPLPRPVNTVYLVQGAVSFWAFCSDIPVQAGRAGYYQQLIDPSYLQGSILITHTENDTAVKNLYTLAMKVSFGETISFATHYPVHGGLGMFGARGNGIVVQDLSLLAMHNHYAFKANTFFNLHASEFIKVGNPLVGGAHNDIAHPEVAHAFWSAIH